MVVLQPIDAQDAVLKLASQNLADNPPQYEQRDLNVGTSATIHTPIPQVVVMQAPPAPPPKDALPNLNYSRRVKFSLRCLYASLSLCIPIHVLQMTPWCAPEASWWLFPIGNTLTITFSTVVTLVIFRDRARLIRGSTTSSSSKPKLPALCKLSTLVPCFLLFSYWVFFTTLVFSFRWTILARQLTPRPGRSNFGEGYLVFPFIELVFIAGQCGVLLAVGIMGSQERKKLIRRLKKKSEEA